MRSLAMSLLAVCLLIAAGAARSQTFDSPFTFNTNPYSAAGSTCQAPWQNFSIVEYGLNISAPTIVYRVVNPYFVFFHPKPHYVRLLTSAVDLSIWVCTRSNLGPAAYSCSDGADNGAYAQDDVTVPAQTGTYYVIVTQSAFGGSPNCGNYLLSEYY